MTKIRRILAALRLPILSLAVLLSAPMSAYAAEVLVLTSATRMDAAPLSGRKGIEIQNNGPNNITCQLRTSTNLTTVKGRIITPGDVWAVGAVGQTAVYCIATTANQVTGAATTVTEAP
jgi:hypothetical protein